MPDETTITLRDGHAYAVYPLPDGQMLQVVLTPEGVIVDGFDGDEPVGTDGRTAAEWFETLTERRPGHGTVEATVNRAANDVLDAVAATDSQRDLVNLVVNAVLSYLDGADDLDDAIAACYDQDPDTVVGWVRDG